MTIRKNKITAIFLVLCFFIISCGSQITESWHDENFKGKFKRIIIIGVTSNFKIRERYEHECKKKLEEAGIDAIASFDRYDDIKALNLQVIKTEVALLAADGVLVTRLIDYKKKEKVVAPQTYGMPYNQPWTDYYYTAYYQAGTRNDGAFTEEKDVAMETRLFDVKTGKVVVSVVTETKTKEANIDAVTSFAWFIVDKMKIAKLLDVPEIK